MYALTISFYHIEFIRKTFGLICKVNSNLINLLGIQEIKQIYYRDSLGTNV
jgi:hypothetical protein